MQKSKSMFLLGNAIAMIAMTSSPAAVGTSVNDAIRETTLLSGHEILEGLTVVKKTLEVEQSKNGVDTERYDVLSQIQTTLFAKAEQVGLTDEQLRQFNLIDEGDGGYKIAGQSRTDDSKLNVDPALADQALAREKMNGGDRFSRAGTRS